MTLIEWITGLAGSVVVIVISTFIKRHHDRLNEMDKRLRETPDENHVRMIVDDKMAPLMVEVREIKSDIHRIERKIDRMLLDKMNSNKSS